MTTETVRMVMSSTTRAHYVHVFDGKISSMAMCGTKAKKWYDAVDEPLCARCHKLHLREVREGEILEPEQKHDVKTQTDIVSYLQTLHRVPCASIPISDLRELRNLLMNLKPNDLNVLKRQMVDTAVKFIDGHIREAEDASRSTPSEMTVTYPGKQ